MRNLTKVLVLVSVLLVTGCASSMKASPLVIDQCKVVATAPVAGPPDKLMQPKSIPIKYTDSQLKNGATPGEVVANQTDNNKLWADDRVKVDGLQEYVHTLQEKGIVAK